MKKRKKQKLKKTSNKFIKTSHMIWEVFLCFAQKSIGKYRNNDNCFLCDYMIMYNCIEYKNKKEVLYEIRN